MLKSLLVSAALLFGFSFSTATASEVWVPEIGHYVPIHQEQPVCRSVLVRRTTIYVDRCGRELYRTVSYRRAYLCDEHPVDDCRPCRGR